MQKAILVSNIKNLQHLNEVLESESETSGNTWFVSEISAPNVNGEWLVILDDEECCCE